MAVDPRTGMTILDEDDCWDLLTTADVGRLAVVVGDDLEVFPVNFVVDGRTLVFRTGEGTKLAAATVAHSVVMEADGFDRSVGEAWSVVVKGEADRLERFSDIDRAEELPLQPWSAHPKQWFVRIEPREVTGRRFIAVRPPSAP
jgi:nitroimidazol reductase NimA-like FMN-containing flavoprotein (pyridoxamine 5'-phosphate oxidase superfamily)